MGVQLIINGDHMTDVMAELEGLTIAMKGSEATTPQTSENVTEEVADDLRDGSMKWWKNHVTSEPVEESTDEVQKEVKKPKKLHGVQHVNEANKMIMAGEINEEIFPLLSDAQKKRVKLAFVNGEPDVTVINHESLMNLMKEKGKVDGKDNPQRYAAFKKIIRDAVPDNKDAKVSNIPTEKLKDVYDQVEDII